MTDRGAKRKAGGELSELEAARKKSKNKNFWRFQRKEGWQPRIIKSGEMGIWATCSKGKESKCVGELRDLLEEYAAELYPTAGKQADEVADGAAMNVSPSADIESEIKAEVANIHAPKATPLFVPVKVDVQCVVFFKTVDPVEPVSLVQQICEDAIANPTKKRTRFVKRLTPMSRMAKATTEGLDKAAREVLAPYFHQEPFRKRKFAIRPSIRNHNILNRNSIIKQIASLVGPGHEVDLTDYELLVLVDVYQHICGISVVGANFESLKRFNLSEIFDPTETKAEQAVEPAAVEN